MAYLLYNQRSESLNLLYYFALTPTPLPSGNQPAGRAGLSSSWLWVPALWGVSGPAGEQSQVPVVNCQAWGPWGLMMAQCLEELLSEQPGGCGAGAGSLMDAAGSPQSSLNDLASVELIRWWMGKTLALRDWRGDSKITLDSKLL